MLGWGNVDQNGDDQEVFPFTMITFDPGDQSSVKIKTICADQNGLP